MKLGTTTTEIIAIGSQFIIFHVYDTLIYKVSDKLSDFKRGELYDMLLWLQSQKEKFKGHSPQKTTTVFIKENIFM